MKRIMIWALVPILAISCRQDQREALFEMIYPNLQFTVDAGLSPVFPIAYERTGLNTRMETYLTENRTDTTQINVVSPISARLTSINGFPYDFLNAVSIRICKDGNQPCRDADEVFYIDRLQLDRPGDRINLLPGLRNARRDLIREKFRLDVVFFLAFTPSIEIETRLDMSFQAQR